MKRGVVHPKHTPEREDDLDFNYRKNIEWFSPLVEKAEKYGVKLLGSGIDAIEHATIDNEGWYDLQGRKLQAKPNRGGIYIHNGKKVVVRK